MKTLMHIKIYTHAALLSSKAILHTVYGKKLAVKNYGGLIGTQNIFGGRNIEKIQHLYKGNQRLVDKTLVVN